MSLANNTLTEEQRLEIAADLHLLVRKRLSELTHAEPQIEDVAQIMACAFGDVCGLMVVKGKGAEIPVLNARAEQSASDIIRSLAEATCEGSA